MPQVNYPHLASMVFNTPLMCTPDLASTIQSAVLSRMLGGGVNIQLPDMPTVDALSPGVDDRAERRIEHSTHHGLSVIPVHGVLASRGTGIDADCNDIVSYESIGNQFDAAMNNDDADELLLDINSFGGAAVGNVDFAEKIYEARQHKKITALVNYNAYSAGYMIASACSEIVLSTTSGVGSIGVRADHIDMSKALDLAGLKITTFYRGHRKNDLTPSEPVSEEAAKVLNAELDDLYGLFVSKVARNRGLSEQAVRDTEAGTYRGQKAIDMGLADRLAYPQDAVNEIAQSIADRKQQERASHATGGGKRIGAQVAAMEMQAQA